MTMSCWAMYSSCRRAMRSPSSREMAWCELASGSSRTRYVEAFERASTSVCTLRLSYLVRRAFGILAASPLSSSAEGLTRTDLASGSGDICLAIWSCQLLLFRSDSGGWARLGYLPGGGLANDPRLDLVSRRGRIVRPVLRFVASVLITSGLLMLADAGLTLAWQEPVSAYLAQRQQDKLGHELDSASLRDIVRREQAAVASIRDMRK